MAKIILVDSDSIFLSNLEWFFFRQSDDHEIITISSREYLQEFFSKPQTADALVISEDMMFPEVERHNITHIFMLTEDDVQSATERLDGKQMSKYTTGIPEMYNIITGILKTASVGGQTPAAAAANIVMVYSPVGGIGTTSTAVGLCASLYKNYKKTLFLSTEGLQTFGSFFTGGYELECWQNNMFRADPSDAVVSLKEMVRTELCDYLPPYNSPLPSVPLTAEDYVRLINAIRASSIYEYVVIDCGCEFTKDISTLMGASDKVVIVFDGQERSQYKVKRLLDSINYSDRSKYVFLRNRYSPEQGVTELEQKCSAGNYTVEKILQADPFPSKISDFLGFRGFQELTNAIM